MDLQSGSRAAENDTTDHFGSCDYSECFAAHITSSTVLSKVKTNRAERQELFQGELPGSALNTSSRPFTFEWGAGERDRQTQREGVRCLPYITALLLLQFWAQWGKNKKKEN